jgi:glyceraldehyde-3-phosphate dehydrogenase (NADP+)
MSETIEVINPYTGACVGRVPRGGAAEIDAAVRRAKEALPTMRHMPLHRRAAILKKTAQLLQERAEAFARLITQETGKTIRETRAEVARAAAIFEYAAEEARRLHGETLPFDAFPNGENHIGFFLREPVGIVGAITPWNVPLALAAHKVAPALAAGNCVVLKPAEQTPLNALSLAEVLQEAGLPEGALEVVTGYGEEAGDALVTHPDVGFLTFTGSREVGMGLPARAGYKRVALELGGNSPVIVTQSADIDRAAEAIVRGGYAVAGQLCISVQRILVHRTVRDVLLEKLIAGIRRLRLGDPLDEATDVGVLISKEACDRVEKAVQEAVQAGARAAIGGKRIGLSAFEPTLLTDVRQDMPIAINEAFAPLTLLIEFDTLAEAITMTNATPYGLNAGIYTRDIEEALSAANAIVAGSVMINEVPTFRSDLMPYGGRKQSGLGREGVRFAIEEMTETKVVCIQRLI